MRATGETLVLQADRWHVRAGRTQLAANLGRAAELTGVPDDVILEIYTALRPAPLVRRTSSNVGQRLEHDFQAPA